MCCTASSSKASRAPKSLCDPDFPERPVFPKRPVRPVFPERPVQARRCRSSQSLRATGVPAGAAGVAAEHDQAGPQSTGPEIGDAAITCARYRRSVGLPGRGARVEQSLGHSGRAVRRAAHHGVPVSERRCGCAAARHQIRCQPCRYRTPDRPLFHAGRRAVAAGRRDRKKVWRQGHRVRRAVADADRPARHGGFGFLGLANCRTADRRRWRRACSTS